MRHARLSLFVLALCLARMTTTVFAATSFVDLGSDWKYRDDGSDQGTAWIAPAFDDSAWPSGTAELGYGDGDEATTLGFGPNPAAKFITTYFRKSFAVTGAAGYAAFQLRLRRDDGAVVYLNGSEILRSNMPAGSITYTTPASTAAAGSDETQFFSAAVTPVLVQEGANVLAVELHQSSGSSSDISFDLDFSGSNGEVTRGPYLQLGTPTSVTVRWRTDIPSDSRVRYGTDPMALTAIADDATTGTDHSVTLTGLSPETLYYYAVGSTVTVLAGGDVEHSFHTAPLAGAARKTRIWVLGDSGTGDANAISVRDAYEAFAGSRVEDLWMMLGDNAYNSGTDAEFEAGVFDIYGRQLRRAVLWPTLGNHDAGSADSATQSGPYYDIFHLPTAAEAGGVPSGTEAYYSFDYGNIHFVCLDSMESDRSPTGAMLTWLEDDLMATTADWVIAFWHHPPYSKGSHNSDTEAELIEMRAHALPILEGYGVDLVLTGHSHSYERSYLLDGHHGMSSSLLPGMVLDSGDGRIDGTGAYAKATIGVTPNQGAVYVVAGSSAKLDSGSLDHPAMFLSLVSLGSLVLDVNHNVLHAQFVDSSGMVSDHFSIIKGGALCGNGLLEPGESCDDEDLGGATCASLGCSSGVLACTAGCERDLAACSGCTTATPTSSPNPTPTPTAAPVTSHDAVLSPVAPVSLAIRFGDAEALQTVRLKVSNADAERSPRSLRISIDSNDCPASLVDGNADFDLRSLGDQDVVLLGGGKSKKARLRLRAVAGDFTSHNSAAPARCTLLINVAEETPGNVDPTAANNQIPLEVSVFDANDGLSPAMHESVSASAAPLRIKISATAATATRRKTIAATNADVGEPAGHALRYEIDAGASTCPPGTVAVETTSANLASGAERAVAVTVTAASGDFYSPSRKSPARCLALLRAVTDEPGNSEPLSANNETRLVIDVVDRHDY